MPREKRTRARKAKRSFGHLPVSVRAGNTEQWLREGATKFVEQVRVLRQTKGQRPDSCAGVW